ncbi:MAG TPA: HEAT repeat domain-containing protein [Phycisphaerae bacterium]|nr:HEAT repeat domain-containing protein [Phycisphaerae bacterium]
MNRYKRALAFHGPFFLVSCFIATAFPDMVRAQDEPAPDLEKAVAALRNIKPGELSEAEQKQRSKEIDEAWRVITLAGLKGLDRLKEEVAKVDREGNKDDFFKLNAARLIWKMVGRRECDTIAAIWNSTDLSAQYSYVFFTAVEAAETQDKKVLPMLRAVLRDDKGSVYIAQHAMNLTWPRPQEFIWGLYGSKGLPVLVDVLKTSKDPVKLRTAIVLLGESHYVDAIPLIRQFAKTGEGKVRDFAIEWLGEFGHPDDYEFLVSGLKAQDADQLAAHVRAIKSYEDLRAVPLLIKLLGTESNEVRMLVIKALECLVTVQGLDALHKHATETKDPKERAETKRFVDSLMRSLKLDWDDYAAKPAEEQALLLAHGDTREQRFLLREGDRKLTHKGLMKAAKEWKKRHTINGGDYKWVEDRHILAAATPQDISLLLDVRASVYTRISDECLDEVETLNDLVLRLARSQYREAVGVCAKVEPKRDKTDSAGGNGDTRRTTPSSKPDEQDD